MTKSINEDERLNNARNLAAIDFANGSHQDAINLIARLRLQLEDYNEMADDETTESVDELDMERHHLHYCQDCFEYVKDGARTCDFCGSDKHVEGSDDD
jgi:hypothetical protein